MSGVISILVALLVFSLLVVVHEAGHFLVAKKNGVYVEEFSVGMGPLLVSKTIGETQYSLRALPIGGYCRMLGEDEEEQSPNSFQAKSVWARMAILVMGPIMNFILGFFLILFVSVSAAGITFPQVQAVLEDSGAAAAGLEAGDRIVRADGQSVGTYGELYLVMDGCQGEDVDLVVERDGQKLEMTVTPTQSADGRWIVGFTPVVKMGLLAPRVDGYAQAGLGETLYDSVCTMRYYVKSVVVGFVRIFTLRAQPEEVTGAIGIVQIMGDTVQEGMRYSLFTTLRALANIAALLSVNLGVINLFPIPAMDGGRLLFLILEAIRRKPINPNMEGMIHFIGFALLMAFMVVIAYQDIVRIATGG